MLFFFLLQAFEIVVFYYMERLYMAAVTFHSVHGTLENIVAHQRILEHYFNITKGVKSNLNVTIASCVM